MPNYNDKGLELFLPDREVVNGWNRKLASSSLDLSGLVPFINLVVLYDSDDIKAIGNSDNVRDRMIDFLIKGDKSKSYGDRDFSIKGVILAENESQIESSNYKGGVGINSLEVTRGTKEAFNIKYRLNMKIMDTSVFDERSEYTSLIQLNTMFLIMYGWSGGNDKLFRNPPQLSNITQETIRLDISSENEGFWKASLCRLWKYDFSYDEEGHIDATLNFMSPQNAILTFLRGSSIASSTLDKISSSATSKDFVSNSAKEIINRIPELKKGPLVEVTIETGGGINFDTAGLGGLTTQEQQDIEIAALVSGS